MTAASPAERTAEGGMPASYVRLGLGLGALAYGAFVVLGLALGGVDGWHCFAALGFALAFGCSFREPTRAGAVALTIGLVEMLSHFARHGIMSGSGLALPVLVAMSGLLLGERAALAMGVVAGVGAEVAAFSGGGGGALTREELERIVVVTLTVTITSALTFAAVRGHRRALAASEAARARTLREAAEREALHLQLEHAQRLETVGLLAGAVAHDFNNVLAAVAGTAEFMEEVGTAEVREAARELLDIQRSGSALTRQLLAFARRDVRCPQPLDLGETVRGMTRLLESILGRERALELVLAPDVHVVADVGQIQQVLANLVSNARDASGPGAPVSVRVRAPGAAEGFTPGCTLPGAMAVIEVEDRGAGMTAEVRERCFEPFFTTKPRGQGTGLGLSTVHGIVGQSGGELTVESAPGQGAIFRVFLPAAPPPTARAAGRVARAAPLAS
ncbi:MAG: ATP-binding protein [Anaeromyxobacteraceae bacterium]